MLDSVTRLDEIPQGFFGYGQSFQFLWYNLYAFGKKFIAENGQILKILSGHTDTGPPPLGPAKFLTT